MHKTNSLLRTCLSSFAELFFPSCCMVCSNDLILQENCVCRVCTTNLPFTNFHVLPNNTIEQIFWGRLPIQNATSILFYRKGEVVQKILQGIKYHHKTQLGIEMGRLMGKQLYDSLFLKDVDVVIPVPLHHNKMRKRGFNQSLLLANGFSEITSIPIDVNTVYRAEDNATQTRKGRFDRFKNVDGIFKLNDNEQLDGKTILLIDDVVTTGSTIEALGSAILQSTKNVKLLVVTLAYAV